MQIDKPATQIDEIARQEVVITAQPIKTAQSVLDELDNSKLSGFHWKAMLTSGMGFFTDAYDLFIIGVALAILKPLWGLNAWEIGLIGSTSMLSAAMGSVVFGRLADFMGRKSIYGLTLIVLAVGALLSALAPNFWWLLIFRFILGLGIGGDYPLSATLMSEYANRKDRGKLITLVFSMQGLGLILGPLIALLLLWVGLSHDWAWRLMLALGAVPAMATYYLRRQIGETPRFMLMQGKLQEAEQTIAEVTQQAGSGSKDGKKQSSIQEGAKYSKLRTLFNGRFLWWLIGTAGAWFLLDVAYYGTTISSPMVLAQINPNGTLVSDTLYTLLIFVVAAFPGYLIAALTIDKLGRKFIQIMGFLMMALAYAVLALIPSLSTQIIPFLIVYGLAYFFTEWGPNVTTFVYPAEIFPVSVRSSAHGLAAAIGKIGAFVGAMLVPFLIQLWGLPGVMGIFAIVSLAGLVLTFTLPEPNGRSLEEITGEEFPIAE